MIVVKIEKDNCKYRKIKILGHAMYDDYGKDIVCSAVSTLMETLANGLTEVVKAEVKVIVDEQIPHLSVTLNEADKEKCKYAQILMESVLLGIKGVAQEFSKFIKIKEKQND